MTINPIAWPEGYSNRIQVNPFRCPQKDLAMDHYSIAYRSESVMLTDLVAKTRLTLYGGYG